MTSQLPCFWCLSQLPAAKKHTKNEAAVTSLRSFLFSDDFNQERWVHELGMLLIISYSIMRYCVYIILRVDKNILHIIWICTVEKVFFNLLS